MILPDILSEAVTIIIEAKHIDNGKCSDAEQIPDLGYPALMSCLSPCKVTYKHSKAQNQDKASIQIIKELPFHLSGKSTQRLTSGESGHKNGVKCNWKSQLSSELQTTINMNLENTTCNNGCLTNNKLIKAERYIQELGQYHQDSSYLVSTSSVISGDSQPELESVHAQDQLDSPQVPQQQWSVTVFSNNKYKIWLDLFVYKIRRYHTHNLIINHSKS